MGFENFGEGHPLTTGKTRASALKLQAIRYTQMTPALPSLLTHKGGQGLQNGLEIIPFSPALLPSAIVFLSAGFTAASHSLL